MAARQIPPNVSIIIPTKDEPYIQELVTRIHDSVEEPHEVIVVDKSDISPKLDAAKVIAQKSDGLGNAFLEGLAIAKGKAIVLMDGDGSHRPEDIQKLLDALQTHDIALGSKFISGGKTSDSFSRQLVSKVFATLTRVILWLPVKDPLSGFAAFRREVFEEIQLKPKGFKIVLEVVYKSKAHVAEVPIFFEERKAGMSKAGWKVSGIKEVFRLFSLIGELKLKVK